MNLKQFFQWLTSQPGYKSRLKYSDAEYFSLSAKDARVATARREQRAQLTDCIFDHFRNGTRRDRVAQHCLPGNIHFALYNVSAVREEECSDLFLKEWGT